MKPAFFVFAGAVSLVGGVLLWLRSNNRREKQAMAATQTSTAAQVARAMPGTLVEVKGTIRCDAPVISRFTKVKAAYFRAEITQEVHYYHTGSDGKRERRTRTEVRRSDVRHAPFSVVDASGAVLVHSIAADIDAVKVYEESQPPSAFDEDFFSMDSTGHSALTYREYVLEPDIPVYVLGTVQADHSIGPPAPTAPPDKKLFLISYKSEEQLAKSAGRAEFWLSLIATLVFALAGYLFWLGLRLN